MFYRMDEINIVLDDGAITPTRAHENDAGLDLYAREDAVIPARGSAKFDTGVHIELPTICVSDGIVPFTIKTAGFVTSKSGLNFKHNLITDGTIDYDYTGSIAVKLYNLGDVDYEVKRGDKISQLCIIPVLTPTPRVIDKLRITERGNDGFGSSGR